MPLPQKKNKFRRGFKTWCTSKAIELRAELGLSDFNPLCAFKLGNHLNVPILEPSKIPGLEKKHLDKLSNSGSDQWSACTIPINDDKYIIVHNPKHSLPRQQSNLMHEFAHIICNHQVQESKMKFGLSSYLRNYDPEQENEAEWLGSCLQLPRPALVWALKNKMSEPEISEYYNASKEMVKYRIGITGVRKQAAYWK